MPEIPPHVPQTRGRLRVVHPAVPVIFTVLCLGMAIKLVPTKQELAKRQLKDGSHMKGLQNAVNMEEAQETTELPEVDEKSSLRTLNESLLDPAKLHALASTPLWPGGIGRRRACERRFPRAYDSVVRAVQPP